MLRSATLLSSTFAALVLAVACGPSMQSVHEGSVRFEHCYRLDLDSDVAPTHRQACWTEWSTRYTYGQSRDRIEYARRRLRSLATGDTARPTLDVDTAYHPEERQFYLSVPAPTSAHAPPPPIATRWAGPSEAPPASSAPSEGAPTAALVAASSAPGDDCATTCRTARSQCDSSCTKGAAGNTSPADVTVCDRCNADYKRCMGRCFR